MCVVDWTALGTWALVAAAIVSAALAIPVARSAAKTFRLEAEPILMVSVDPRLTAADAALRMNVSQSPDGKPFFLPVSEIGLSDIRTYFIVFENLGRSPAFDVKVGIRADVTDKPSLTATLPVFMQGLASQARFVVAVHNASNSQITLMPVGATSISLTSKNMRREELRLLTSSAFPLRY
jgi:hypothetical protein